MEAKKYKGKYVIYYYDLINTGCVKFVLFKKQKPIGLGNQYEQILFATKFKYKWIADLLCKLCNYNSLNNFELKTYKVIKL